MTEHVGILGYPLQHTISPAFQQAAFHHLGMDVVYHVWETEPSRLQEAVQRLRSRGYLGANVTIPFKEALVSLVDEVNEKARELVAVNTIVRRNGGLEGYNTDVDGFLQALRNDGGMNPRGKTALVLGAGGSARAVCFGLVWSGIRSLFITSRTLARAKALAEELYRKHGNVRALPWLEGLPMEYDLLVNCTPLGMAHGPYENISPLEGAKLPPHALVYDLVYNPSETPLLMEAKAQGCRVLSGLPMLVYQGAQSFKLWTGKEPPLEVMFKAARDALV
jgi:shikimate dehydrogenase